MKVKCINNKELPCNEKLTVGKVYEVLEELSGDHISVKNDDGYELGYLRSRFEPTLEDLEEQLQSAKLRVSELEAKIEAQKPKIGQKYKHSDGSIYMLCMVGSKYALICIADDENYIGDSYYGNLTDSIDELPLMTKNFTLLP
jgi:hypothetical protein